MSNGGGVGCFASIYSHQCIRIVLYLIFINDLPLYNPNHKTDLFADDSTISATGKNKLCIIKTLNTVLEDISHWCYENRMVLNVSKTKTMCIGSKQNFVPNLKKYLIYLSMAIKSMKVSVKRSLVFSLMQHFFGLNT